MPMSPRLLRPRQTIHPEAADWAKRVRDHGSSVSGTTLVAVSKFCRAIDSAGIRSLLYRVNLFCGGAGSSDTTRLNACLVPLYRGPSLGGTQYGETTDTNVNFTSPDYVETGAFGGLNTQGNFTRRLAPGSFDGALGIESCHFSCYAKLRSGQTSIGGFGAFFSTSQGQARIQFRGTSQGRIWIGGQFWNGDFSPVATVTQNTFVFGARTSSSNAFNQFNGVANGSDTDARTIPAREFFTAHVFSDGSGNFFDGIMGGYTLGIGMTTSQAQSLNVAMQTFQSAMGRA